MNKNFPGLILVILLALISIILNRYLLNFIETLTIGILLGIALTNTVGYKKLFEPGITFSLKKVLKWGIVLLGVKLNFDAILKLGPWIVLIVIIIITLAQVMAHFLGKFGHLNPKLSSLLGVGSSICGASAIVAMGPVINADEEDVAVSVTVISLLGAIGVIIYTLLSYILPLSEIQYGIWSGSSLQGVAHALAAAGAKGQVSLQIGTIVKMARVALLAPVALILSYVFNKNDNSTEEKKVKFPMYVLFFILVGIIFTLNSIYEIVPTTFIMFRNKFDIVNILKEIGNFFILMAMVAMGLKVNLKSFKSKGIKAFYICSFLFVMLSTISYILVQMV